MWKLIWKLFIGAGVPFGVAMALIVGGKLDVESVEIGLASGLLFGLLMAVAFGGKHWLAGNPPIHASREFMFPAPPEVAIRAARRALSEVRSRNVTELGGTLTASMPGTWDSSGESICIEIASSPEEGSLVRVSSSPRMRTALVDGGKNQSNVDALTSAILRQRVNGAARLGSPLSEGDQGTVPLREWFPVRRWVAVLVYGAVGWAFAGTFTLLAQRRADAWVFLAVHMFYFGAIGAVPVAEIWVVLRRRRWEGLLAGLVSGTLGGPAGGWFAAAAMYIGFSGSHSEMATKVGPHLFAVVVAALVMGGHAVAFGLAGVLVGPALAWYERRAAERAALPAQDFDAA
jgi:hypothetical protein